MTETSHLSITLAERGIRRATDWLNRALKDAFLGQTVETQVGRHTVRSKVIDAEDGMLVLENGARREWRKVEPVVICDRQGEAQRHEVGETSKEKVVRIEWELTKTGECERLEDVPKGAKVVGIDDKNVVAQCEACGKWILDGDLYASSEDADLCQTCADECAEAEAEEEP